MKTNPVTKESTFEVPNPMLGYVLLALRYACMLGFYGGAIGVAYSIFTFEAPAGPEATLPVSPTSASLSLVGSKGLRRLKNLYEAGPSSEGQVHADGAEPQTRTTGGLENDRDVCDGSLIHGRPPD